MAQLRQTDWRALLNQPSAASVVVKKSPFAVRSTPGGSTPPVQAHARAAEQQQQQQHLQGAVQQEHAVPILLLKAVTQLILDHKRGTSSDPQQELKQLQDLQQLTSSLLAAAAELAQTAAAMAARQQEEQDVSGLDDPYLRRPVFPPHHAQQDEPYFWSGSRTSTQQGPGAGSTPAGGYGPGNSSNLGPDKSSQVTGVISGGAASMETSQTTRVLPARESDVLSTACSPAQSWGSALMRLKQLQLETLEALEM